MKGHKHQTNLDTFSIEKATPQDHITLTAITKDGKAYWGYSTEQLAKWENDLTIAPNYICENETYKLVLAGEIIGYYSYLNLSKGHLKLDNLFLYQKYIGQGFGRILLTDFLEKVRKLDVVDIILEADPNAEDYYKKFGFLTYGQRPSTIKGRSLPKMRLDLTG